jgi:hypothetical protein
MQFSTGFAEKGEYKNRRLAEQIIRLSLLVLHHDSGSLI